MTNTDIKNFFSLAKTKIGVIEKVRHYFGKETSPRFNSFDFWWIDENKVSQILAFFLDPNQNHEQGDIYLKHFIKKFGLLFFKYEEGEKIYVECEHRTGNGRRIDVVIYKDGFTSAIGIENKIRTETDDQHGQLKHYNDYLKSKTENYHLIYLSPQEKSVGEHSISAKEKVRLEGEGILQCVSYEKHMIDCVNEFAMMTESIRVRSFIKDFEKTLRKKYMGQKDLEAKEAVIDLINESDKNLEISFMVLQSLTDVKGNLIKRFESQVEKMMTELGLIQVDDGLNFRPSNWKDFCISISLDRTEVYYGLSHYDKSIDITRLRIVVDSIIRKELKGNFISTPSWPVYEYLDRTLANSPDFWLAIKNDKATTRIKEFAKFIIDNFNTDDY